MEQYYVTVTDVMNIMHISESMAYKIIRDCNAELKAENFITVRGKCPRAYFFKRVGLMV